MLLMMLGTDCMQLLVAISFASSSDDNGFVHYYAPLLVNSSLLLPVLMLMLGER